MLLTVALTLAAVGVAYGALRLSNLLVWNGSGAQSSTAELPLESRSMPEEGSAAVASEPAVSQPEKIGIGRLSCRIYLPVITRPPKKRRSR